MATGRPQSVVVNIMGKEYRIICEPEESENLRNSARELNEQMCKMRDSGKIAGPERIAVMTALNLTHELQSLKSNATPVIGGGWKDCLDAMLAKIENILEKH